LNTVRNTRQAQIGRTTTHQDAKSDAAIPIRYVKIGTAMASTNAMATATKHRKVQTTQPNTVWVWRWREFRKKRMKSSLAAVCEYRPPARRKLPSAMPKAALDQVGGNLHVQLMLVVMPGSEGATHEKNAGEATVFPIYAYITTL
jgi:hypothetical protein